MLEHRPWIGPNFKSGIRGERICIVGYSHHYKEGESDDEDFTEYVVKQHLSGTLGANSFLPHIAGYFDFLDKVVFWNSVMFFNFLPDAIGPSARRFKDGEAQQIERGRERFVRLVADQRPHKVFVFTTKGWSALPPSVEVRSGRTNGTLGSEFPKFSWGTYVSGEHTATAFGLRHPQGASGKRMESAVRYILAKPFFKTAHN